MAYIYKVEKTILNDQFTVKLSLLDITEADVQLMAKYGAPVVDFGGSFTGPPAFTLPVSQRNLQTGLPVQQIFDGNADPAAESKANVYDSEIRVRISTEMVTLRANVDTFTLEEDVEV